MIIASLLLAIFGGVLAWFALDLMQSKARANTSDAALDVDDAALEEYRGDYKDGVFDLAFLLPKDVVEALLDELLEDPITNALEVNVLREVLNAQTVRDILRAMGDTSHAEHDEQCGDYLAT
jgi:hypothetical protein